jgi:hypothetical protein
MQQIHHKKNKQGIIEFTNSFESEHLFLEKLDAEVLFELSMRVNNNTVFIPSPCTISGTTLHYIRECWQDNCPDSSFVFLDDTTPNLSKYTPKDNAVLFLDKGTQSECENSFMPNEIYTYVTNNIEGKSILENIFYYGTHINELHQNITIFLPHGTQSELQKAEEVAKELREKYGVEEVNLFVLHCFIPFNTTKKWTIGEPVDFEEFTLQDEIYPANKMIKHINKIITTNSTGILPVEDNERLQVIDCKEIFEEYLKENN